MTQILPVPNQASPIPMALIPPDNDAPDSDQGQDQGQDQQASPSSAPSGGTTIGAQLASKGVSAPVAQPRPSAAQTLAALAMHLLSPAIARQQPQQQPGQDQQQQPQSRLGRVVSGVGQVVGGVLHDFGDAAAVKGAPGVQGAANVLAARNQRLVAENDESINTAHAQLQQLYQQRLLHNLDVSDLRDQAKDGAAYFDSLKKTGDVQVYGEGMTSDEYHEFLKTHVGQSGNTATDFQVVQTGVVSDPDQPSGVRGLYSVIGFPQQVTVSKELANSVNPWLPDNQKIQEGSTMSGRTLHWIRQQAADAQTATAARDKTLEDNELADADRAQKLAVVRIGPEWANALANANNDPLKALAAMQANPALVQKYPNLYQTVRQAYGEKAFDALVEERQKKLETSTDLISEIAKDPTKIEGKTSSVMAAATAILQDPNASQDKKQAAQKVYNQAKDTRALEVQLEGAKDLQKTQIKKDASDRTNPNGLTGDAFIRTLPPGRAAALKAINNGSVAVNPSALERSDKGQALMDDIYAAYPDFQAYKGETWPKAYNEYMGSGATAKARINYNTALSHLQDLYNNSTAEGLYNPSSKAYQDRQAAYNIVVNEVGKAIKTGVITEGEGKELQASLNGWFPSTAKERAAHVASLLKNKIDEFQTAFQDSAPSASIKTPILISPQAQAAYDAITTQQQNGGKTQPNQQQPQAQPKPGRNAVIVNGQVVGYTN